MIICKYLDKIRDRQGKIIGYRLQDKNGAIRNVRSLELKNAIYKKHIDVINLTLTKDGRLISKKPETKKKSSKPDIKEVIRKAIALGLHQNLDGSHLIKTGNQSYILYIPDNIEKAPSVAVVADTFDTLKVIGGKGLKSIAGMFACQTFKTLDLSELDTSRVVDMGNLFNDCHIDKEIKLGKFDTSNVNHMTSMFCDYTGVDIDLSGFNTSKVTNMYGMFLNCGMEKIDLSNFDVRQVYTMTAMFEDCQASTIKLWDATKTSTDNLREANEMFNGCTLEEDLDLSGLDTSRLTELIGMFKGLQCASLDLRNFRVDNVSTTVNMFKNCSISVVMLPQFTDSLYSTASMFSWSSITNINLNNINTKNVVHMNSMFENCQIADFNISKFDTSRVDDMTGMFCGAELGCINLSNFDTQNVKYMANMFTDCYASEINLSNFKISKDCDISDIFEGCEADDIIIKDSLLLEAYECK